MLPKCPLCVLTIAATFGIELPISRRWLSAATFALLALSITLIARMCEPGRRRGLLAIALSGAVLIAIGRASTGPAALLVHAGAVVIIAASVRASCRSYCMAEESGRMQAAHGEARAVQKSARTRPSVILGSSYCHSPNRRVTSLK